MKNIFASLKKAGNNPTPYSIAELICNVVIADIRNLIPGDVVTRTQKSIELLNDISEDMIYSGGSIDAGDDLPDALDDNKPKQITSATSITSTIKSELPEEEITLGNEEGKIAEEVGAS